MRPKSSNAKKPAEQVAKDIRRATRRHFSTDDKIRIALDGLLPPMLAGAPMALSSFTVVLNALRLNIAKF